MLRIPASPDVFCYPCTLHLPPISPYRGGKASGVMWVSELFLEMVVLAGDGVPVTQGNWLIS
jgi:hypothetical protein